MMNGALKQAPVKQGSPSHVRVPAELQFDVWLVDFGPVNVLKQLKKK